MVSGKGRNLVKGPGKKNENGRSLGIAPKTEQGIVIIEMIGIIGIVIEPKIERGKENVGGIGIGTVIVNVHVIVTGPGNVVVTMSVIGIVTVIATVKRRGIGIVIMKLLMLTMIAVDPVIETMTMIRVNINMSETDRVTRRETMIRGSKRDGMNNLNMDISGQRGSMGAMTTMNITRVKVNMIIKMPREMRIATKILTDTRTGMIIWRRIIMVMIVAHQNHKKRTVITGDQIGQFLVNTITDDFRMLPPESSSETNLSVRSQKLAHAESSRNKSCDSH